MASKVIVFGLLLVAIVGVALADTTTPDVAAAAPPNDDTIGNEGDNAPTGAPAGGDGEAVPGPLGSATAAAAAGPSAESPTGSSGASVIEVSAIAGVAAVGGFLLF